LVQFRFVLGYYFGSGRFFWHLLRGGLVGQMYLFDLQKQGAD
jgi:hypothetical protein